MARRLKIAIADDEEVVRHHFAAALERLGHTIVVAAANGRELLDACLRERPELLITDIRMDGLSGIDAMQKLAKNGPMPTILISADFRPIDLPCESEGQVVAFLTKPIKLADLASAVADATAMLA